MLVMNSENKSKAEREREEAKIAQAIRDHQAREEKNRLYAQKQRWQAELKNQT